MLRPIASDSAGARTQDPDIKSVVLYQLSYRVLHHFRVTPSVILRAQK